VGTRPGRRSSTAEEKGSGYQHLVAHQGEGIWDTGTYRLHKWREGKGDAEGSHNGAPAHRQMVSAICSSGPLVH
jgi:hypothetical protein